MKRINSLATQRPLVYGFSVTFVYILLVLISSIVVGAIWPGETPGWYIGSTIGRLVWIIILLMVLWRLGWLQPAGFTQIGARRAWLVMLAFLAYMIVASAYAMTGNFNFTVSDPALASLAAVFLMSHAFLEETVFRGLILHGFVRAWGYEYHSQVRSVLVAALLFGGYHLIYLAGEPLPVVLMRVVFSSLLGIVLGVLVLRGGSIYPAAFFHGSLNLAGYLNLTSNGVEGSVTGWLLMILGLLPLAIYGLYWLRDASRVFTLSNPLSKKMFR